MKPMTAEEYHVIFSQLKKGLLSVALEVSEDDSKILKELFMKLGSI